MTLPVPRISATDAIRSAALPEPDIQALTQRFDQLMSKDQTNSAAANTSATFLPPQVSDAIHSMDSSHRQIIEDLDHLMVNARHMDMQTITALNSELIIRTGISQAQITMSSAVAKSGKDALTTLMKNQ
jgi:hypothetical protein